MDECKCYIDLPKFITYWFEGFVAAFVFVSTSAFVNSLDCDMDFPAVLVISPCMADWDASQVEYHLHATINLHSEDSQCGHYVVFIKRRCCQWFCLNDEQQGYHFLTFPSILQSVAKRKHVMACRNCPVSHLAREQSALPCFLNALQSVTDTVMDLQMTHEVEFPGCGSMWRRHEKARMHSYHRVN